MCDEYCEREEIPYNRYICSAGLTARKKNHRCNCGTAGSERWFQAGDQQKDACKKKTRERLKESDMPNIRLLFLPLNGDIGDI